MEMGWSKLTIVTMKADTEAHLLYKSWILDQLLNNLCVCILSAPKEWQQKHDVTKRFLFEKLAKQVWKRLKTTEYKFNA